MVRIAGMVSYVFPAEYGNAISGVFDLKMKTGNHENYEHTFQLGFMGIDFASEGPLLKSNHSSYAFNYRYSTLGLISKFMSYDMNIPIYQDLSFKLNYPTRNAGIFSLWGIGFLDEISEEAPSDTANWKYDNDSEESRIEFNMGTIGLAHKIIIGKNSYLNSTLAYNTTGVLWNEWELDYTKNKLPREFIESQQQQLIFSTNIYHKFNTHHYNKTGLDVRSLFYNVDIKKELNYSAPIEQIVNENDNSQLFRAYTQSEVRVNENWTLNLGLNFQYFAFNKDYSIEPRSGIKWDFLTNQSLSFGYGLHSRWEVLGIYMAQQQTTNGTIRPNKDLDLAKAHHFVLGYDIKLTKHTRLKIESYYQYLFDVPVIPDSSYSLLNMQADWYFNENLENSGTGSNLGVDFTLERYLNNHYYYLMTASIFQSKYKGGDGIQRNTRFNRNYIINILGGKEWIVGKKRNKILGINLRFQLLGGDRRNPLDVQKSLEYDDIIYDETNPFDKQGPTAYHIYVTLTYRINKSGYSSIWAFQLYNFPGSKDFIGYNYNLKTGKYEKEEVYVFFPLLSYKIEF